MAAIEEVVDWEATSIANTAHHPVGPQGREARRTSLSFQELQAAIARFNAAPSFPGNLTAKGPLILDGDNPYTLHSEADASAANKNWLVGVASEGYYIQVYNDTFGAGANALIINRTANVVDSIALFATDIDLAGSVNATTGDVVLETAGKGIDFSANTGAAGEENSLLDWYEEGTWTPVLSDGTNNATHDIQVGFYTRIGRTVFFQVRVKTTALGSVTGNIRITGLPFISISGNSSAGVAVGWGSALAITSGQNVGGFVVQNQSYIFLTLWDAVTGTTSMQATEWSADGSVMMSGSYRV